jgi:hypothetical protein
MVALEAALLGLRTEVVEAGGMVSVWMRLLDKSSKAGYNRIRT